MSKPETYTQCELRQTTPTGYRKKVCWIPSYGAVLDNVITLEDVHGEWTVVHVGSSMDSKLVKQQAHKSEDIWTATSGPNPRGNK